MLDGMNEPGVTTSLNHLIRPNEYRLRDRQPQRLGGLEVDDKLELRNLFDREGRGLGALQDAVHVAGGGSTADGAEVVVVGKKARRALPIPCGAQPGAAAAW